MQVVGLTHGMLPFSATEQVFCSLGSSMTMARNICEKSRSAILFSVSEARSSNRRFPFPLAKHPLGSPCRRSDTPFTVQLEQALRGNSADAAASLLIGCVQKKGFGLHPGQIEEREDLQSTGHEGIPTRHPRPRRLCQKNNVSNERVQLHLQFLLNADC